MKLPKLLLCSVLLFGGPNTFALAGIVTFDFEDGTSFDNAGAGVSMVATNGTDTVTATTVDILAPQYSSTSPFPTTGVTLSAASGDGVQTSILASNSSLGVNNPSISNTNFGVAGGPTGGGGESANFNLDEVWVMEFDQPVRIALFNFSSLDVGEQFDVTVEDVIGVFSFTDDGGGDDYASPLGSLIIPTGKNLTFTATGSSLAAVNCRITEIQVETIPEPSSMAIIVLVGAVPFCFFRRQN